MSNSRFERDGFQTALEGTEQQILEAEKIREAAFVYIDGKMKEYEDRISELEDAESLTEERRPAAEKELSELKEGFDIWKEVGEGLNEVFRRSVKASGLVNTRKHYEKDMLERLYEGIRLKRIFDREDPETEDGEV